MSILDEIRIRVYMRSRRDCVGLLISGRRWSLTNCASYDTLAKVTSPGGIYKHLEDLNTTLILNYYTQLILNKIQLIEN